jgi:transketolase
MIIQQNVISGTMLRRKILEQSFRAGVGHIGSALSIADLVAAVATTFPTCTTAASGRDRFVLSKGHASLAWYVALESVGVLTSEELNSFCGDGSELGVHPEPHTNGVDFGSGSLGMGLSFAVGTALASKLLGETTRTAVIMSDAECNEGIVWESASFAAQHKLDRLVVLIDDNKQQALGATSGILDQKMLADRWRSFGWAVEVCDGHNIAELSTLMENVVPGKPKVLVAQTVFGSGVSYMERALAWHYLPMNREQYEIALNDIAALEIAALGTAVFETDGTNQ